MSAEDDGHSNDQRDSTATMNPTVSDNTGSCIRSELLCYVHDKSQLLPVDDLVKICTDFYKNDEIYAARKIIDNAGQRMPKRTGTNKLRTTVEDIVKAVLDPDRSLPTFYATDLSRLPPTDVKHCDMSGILAELQSLRSEVRAMRHLNDEVTALRQQVADLVGTATVTHSELSTLRIYVPLRSLQIRLPIPSPDMPEICRPLVWWRNHKRRRHVHQSSESHTADRQSRLYEQSGQLTCSFPACIRAQRRQRWLIV